MFESNVNTGCGLPGSTQTSPQKLQQQQDGLTYTLPPNMINPFTSNNQQFLFRKNYDVINKPAPPTPSPFTPSTYKDSSLNRLQSRNPFRSQSPIAPILTSITSPSRPVSLSRSNVSSHQSFLPIKPGILKESDGWKRDIENQERQKFSTYGAEGLRYNAYIHDDPPVPQTKAGKTSKNEYYTVSNRPEPNEPKAPLAFQKYDSAINYCLSPTQNVLPNKPRLQMFQDEIDESPNFNVVDPRKDSFQEGSRSSKYSSKQDIAFDSRNNKMYESRNSKFHDSGHSKINDMFESHYQDRLKRSMQYGSFYALNEDMMESKKREQQKSKEGGFYRQNSKGMETETLGVRRTVSVESSVHQLDVVAPGSINLWGTLYQRVHL